MRRFVLAAAALCLVPGLTLAQRGGGSRSKATSHTDMFPSEQMRQRVAAVSSNKLRDLDPLAILIDKRKDVRLTDEQVAQLKQMHDQLDQVQQPVYHVVDSLNQKLANLGSSTSSDDQSRVQTTTSFLRLIAGTVRQRYDSVERDALGLLTEEQKQKAGDVLKDSHEELIKVTGRGRN